MVRTRDPATPTWPHSSRPPGSRATSPTVRVGRHGALSVTTGLWPRNESAWHFSPVLETGGVLCFHAHLQRAALRPACSGEGSPPEPCTSGRGAVPTRGRPRPAAGRSGRPAKASLVCHFHHVVLLCAGLERSITLPVPHRTSSRMGPAPGHLNSARYHGDF